MSLLLLFIIICKGSNMDIYHSNNFYNCKWCNRKYKTVKKFKQHVEQNHPSATLNSNWKALTIEESKYILTQLSLYSKAIKDGTFVDMSHKLLPTNDNIGSDELERITRNHVVFCQRVQESGLLDKVLSNAEQLELLLKEFTRFLNLGQPWAGGNFCPTLTIDLMWHASMMSSAEYKTMSTRFLGTVLPHCLNENEDNHQERYMDFEKRFVHYHRQLPLKIDRLILGNEDGIKVLFDKWQQQAIKQKAEDELRWAEQQKRYKAACLKEEQRQAEYYAQNGYYPRSIWDDGKC